MNGFIIRILDLSTYLSAMLIIFIGCLVTLCLLLYPVWYLLNTVLYKRAKGSLYFLTYYKRRKEFAKWYKDNKPNVYKPTIKK